MPRPRTLLETAADAGTPLRVGGRTLAATHASIAQILASRLGRAHAELLAAPLDAGEGRLRWSTTLEGEPVPAAALPDDERQRLQQRADRLLADIRGLGQQLKGEGGASSLVGQMVEQAAAVPSGDWLYSVGGKPVLAMWGHAPSGATVADSGATPAAAAVAAAAAVEAETAAEAPALATPAIAAASPWPRRLAIGAAALALLAAAAFGMRRCAEPPPDDGLAAKLAQAESDNRDLEAEIARRRALKPSFQCVPPEPPASAPTVAEAPSAPTPASAPEPPPKQLAECPGRRPVEEAPQVAIVFDTSPSMNYSLNASPAAIQRAEQQAEAAARMAALGLYNGPDPMDAVKGEPRRITPAREAATTIARNLPADVGAGLVLVDSCRDGARPIGFFGPHQRDALVSRLRSLRAPQADQTTGTPLADGIAKGARLVDGVKRDAMLLVISDGEESCKGDPCAVAAAIARAKPRLRINVLDITGAGAGNCLAQATGGKVFTARNAKEIAAMMNRAAQDAMAPAACR